MINLSHWFNPKDVRPHIKQPFNYKGMTVASTGHIIIFTPAALGNSYQEISLEGAIQTYERILKRFDGAELKPFPASLALPEPETCPACQGRGKAKTIDCDECEGDGFIEFENDRHVYEVTCKSCSGDGEITVGSNDTECANCNGFGTAYAAFEGVELDGGHYQAKYLRLIINEPDLLYTVWPEDLSLLFKTGANFGAIMPFKP